MITTFISQSSMSRTSKYHENCKKESPNKSYEINAIENKKLFESITKIARDKSLNKST